ncbi:MAG: APC family permease, partial [Candidatus Micrarchaeales archaeon]
MKEDGKISQTVATAVALGAIIGAGIFVLSGTAIALAGADALIAFIIVGIVAIIIALEFGELGSIVPYAKGAAYSYIYKAIGSEPAFITGIIQYFSYATAISVIALGFGSYLASILGLSVSFYAIPFAIGLIFVLTLVNAFGIRSAANTDSILVFIKIIVLLVFIIFSLWFALNHGSFNLSNFSVLPSQGGLGPLFAASIAIFFAYSGFQIIATFTSKVRGGSKSAAKAILYSTIISMVLYVLVVVALILLVPASGYTISADPLSFALQHSSAPGWLVILIDIGALIATTSASLAMMLSSSRMLYQISADRLLPKIFRKYDKKKDVAINAVIVSAIIAVVMLFSGNIYEIAAISNFGLLFSYLMASLALVHFRTKKVKSEFKLPFYPYLTIIAILAILVFIIGLPQSALIIGLVLIISLIAVYYLIR